MTCFLAQKRRHGIDAQASQLHPLLQFGRGRAIERQDQDRGNCVWGYWNASRDAIGWEQYRRLLVPNLQLRFRPGSTLLDELHSPITIACPIPLPPPWWVRAFRRGWRWPTSWLSGKEKRWNICTERPLNAIIFLCTYTQSLVPKASCHEKIIFGLKLLLLLGQRQ
jgi:hypothetical protein